MTSQVQLRNDLQCGSSKECIALYETKYKNINRCVVLSERAKGVRSTALYNIKEYTIEEDHNGCVLKAVLDHPFGAWSIDVKYIDEPTKEEVEFLSNPKNWYDPFKDH